MRKPRLRQLSDHDITQELLVLMVEELLESTDFESNRAPRLLALIDEMNRRRKWVAESYCTCSDCMFVTGDGPDPRIIPPSLFEAP